MRGRHTRVRRRKPKHTLKNRESSIAAIDRELAELRSKARYVVDGRAFNGASSFGKNGFPRTTETRRLRRRREGRRAPPPDCWTVCARKHTASASPRARTSTPSTRRRRDARARVAGGAGRGTEETSAARRTLLREGRTSESARSQRDDLAAMRGEAMRCRDARATEH